MRASRFTRLSMNMQKLDKREPSIVNKVSKVTNFDYLALRTETNKLFKRVSQFLMRQGESKYLTVVFSDYMYKIDSKLNKTKRIIIVTETNLYQLSLNLSLIVKIPVKDISSITIIKSSSAVLALHVNQSFDFLMETIRRTELLLYLINICDNQAWPRPHLI